ncbi:MULTISPECIES: hypothetical protein [unclassified Sedimentibacter]|uniref:hypothetical protein n=1 Tax=unclassified Sedimentibacter TaxID=2649220 RepID=UPI0027E1038B|nr:hypothetical protein [Sedimentibacter sp. MB35-C1]WMJ78633.1 hypothetical protein RBQ61_06825 [Sedimentibacter sp. MB35-C1]
MDKLLEEKKEAAIELRNFTKEIIAVSLKTEYEKANSMIDERKKHIEKINSINTAIEEYYKDYDYADSESAIKAKKEIRAIFAEIAEMDKTIRKKINVELKDIKNILIQPEQHSKKTLNIRA